MRGKAWMASIAREEGRNSGTCLDRAGAAAGLSGACGSDDLDGGRVLVKKGEEDVAEGACAGRRKESRVCARAGAWGSQDSDGQCGNCEQGTLGKASDEETQQL